MQAVWIESVDFLHAWALPIAIASGALFVLTLLLTPYMVARIPVDYFAHPKRQRLQASLYHPAVDFVLVSGKNILGAVLLMLGIIMLFGPGPGIATLLFSLSIMNFPGKYRIERWIITRPMVLQSINALRKRHGQAPLICKC